MLIQVWYLNEDKNSAKLIQSYLDKHRIDNSLKILDELEEWPEILPEVSLIILLLSQGAKELIRKKIKLFMIPKKNKFFVFEDVDDLSKEIFIPLKVVKINFNNKKHMESAVERIQKMENNNAQESFEEFKFRLGRDFVRYLWFCFKRSSLGIKFLTVIISIVLIHLILMIYLGKNYFKKYFVRLFSDAVIVSDFKCFYGSDPGSIYAIKKKSGYQPILFKATMPNDGWLMVFSRNEKGEASCILCDSKDRAEWRENGESEARIDNLAAREGGELYYAIASTKCFSLTEIKSFFGDFPKKELEEWGSSKGVTENIYSIKALPKAYGQAYIPAYYLPSKKESSNSSELYFQFSSGDEFTISKVAAEAIEVPFSLRARGAPGLKFIVCKFNFVEEKQGNDSNLIGFPIVINPESARSGKFQVFSGNYFLTVAQDILGSGVQDSSIVPVIEPYLLIYSSDTLDVRELLSTLRLPYSELTKKRKEALLNFRLDSLSPEFGQSWIFNIFPAN